MKINLILNSVAAVCVTFAMQASAFGQLTVYNQDFDSLTVAMSGAPNGDLAADGWKVFANVFTSGGDFAYNYGVFDAPNENAAFSSVATGATAPSGSNYLNVFNDYNNTDHGNGSDNVIEALVFQEQTVGAGDVGQVWTMSAAYQNADGGNGIADDTNTTGTMFVKVLDSLGGSFATLAEETFDTSLAPATFEEASIDFTIDASHSGQLLQFGFTNRASNFQPTGVFFDDVSFSVAAVPEPSSAMICALVGLGALARRRR